MRAKPLDARAIAEDHLGTKRTRSPEFPARRGITRSAKATEILMEPTYKSNKSK